MEEQFPIEGYRREGPGERRRAQVEIPFTVISVEQESLPMSLEAWQKYFPVSALSALRMVSWAVFSTQLIL